MPHRDAEAGIMDSIIRTEKVCKIYKVGDGDFYALNNVSVEIPRGKLVILKGRSGSGKTTLINTMSTLDTASDGDVIFDQQKLTDMSDADKERLRREKIGFVFQSVALIPVMSSYENVEFALRLNNMHRGGEERIREVLELVGMGERMNHMPGQMSGGEQQRVAIARAIVHKPVVLFADEPTAALDTGNGLKIMRLFRDLVEKEGITVVMTTHDPGLMELGDVVYELSDGAVINHIVRE